MLNIYIKQLAVEVDCFIARIYNAFITNLIRTSLHKEGIFYSHQNSIFTGPSMENGENYKCTRGHKISENIVFLLMNGNSPGESI